MDGFCRGCLNSFDDPTDLLQYTEESRRLFVYSTGLQVKRNDLFTFQLCKECYFSMKTSCKFKKMCRTSDKKIKNYLALRDVDDDMDFGVFLKKNDESVMFRLPMLSGGSTPGIQRAKDDDTESTSTSIQNFMSDMLRAEEIPDTEARIIKEVIEEEADVLEDSLDSHWLRDDISVDSDFRLDLSLSRFSTPHSTNNDRMCSPEHRNVTSTDITSGEDYDNIPIDSTLKKITDPVNSSYVVRNVLGTGVQTDLNKTRCVIDKNLEKALRDENNQEFALEKLLASPSAYRNTPGASTPTIKHILFGDNTNNKTSSSSSNNFESDLDLFMGKLKSKSDGVELHNEKFDVDKLLSGKTLEAKLDSENTDMTAEKILDSSKKHFNKHKENKANTGRTSEMSLPDNKNSEIPYLESDFDLLIGKLDKAKSKDGLNSTHFDINNLFSGDMKKEKIDLGKLFIEKKQQDNIDLGKSSTWKSEKSIFDLGKNLSIGKSNSGNLGDMSFENLPIAKVDLEKISTGKLQQEKITTENPVTERLDSQENSNFEKFQGGKSDLADLSIGKLHDGKLDLEDLSIEILLDVETGTEKNDVSKLLDDKLHPGKIYVEGLYKGNGKHCVEKLKNAESNDDILEEFLNTEKGKSDHIGTKQNVGKCIDSGNQIDDAELTELLQEAYEQNTELIKGDKRLDIEVRSVVISNNDKDSSNEKALLRDKKNISPEKIYCITNFYCKLCNKKFINLLALKIHFGKFHQFKIKTPKKPRKVERKVCDICGKSYTNTISLSRHIESHEKSTEHSCEKCPLKFKTANALNSHKSTHMKIKPLQKSQERNSAFMCTICGASSNSSSNFLLHQRRHAKVYTIYCEECGRGFYRTTELTLHMRSHTKEKPFACTFCGRAFARRDVLNKHMKKHTDEKPYACQFCNQKFVDRFDLKTHELKNIGCRKLRDKIIGGTELIRIKE